jgi:pimeloyl-ACP methyl ester carboxylesterase
MPMLDVKGVSLYYNVKGNGTPIVFIHPPLLTSENFRYQIEELSQYFKVISFDIRGHGRSEYSPKPITFHLIAEDITHLLDHLEIEKAVLCGYSTGASVALEFMLTYLDRAFVGILVSGMSEASDFYNRQRISLAVKLAKSSTFSILAKAITIGNADSMVTLKTLYREAEKGDVKNINQYFQYSLEYNCTEQLEKIELPVLLVYGKKDKSFHQFAKLLHEKLPYNELKFLSKEKHQIPTKAAQKLNQLMIDFVRLHNKQNG